MGMVIPADFDFGSLANDAERQVVRQLRDRLSDRWMVLPDVGLSLDRDHQLDVVLLHPEFGVLDLEVKGHRPHLDEGVWYSGNERMEPQPFAQAKGNAYALRGRLRVECDLPKLGVEYAVAFPNATALEGRLPTDVDRTQLLLGPDLDDVEDALERLMTRRFTVALDRDDLESIVSVLRPDLEFSWDPLAQATSTRQRLDEICEEQIRALEVLDLNRRVAASGAAGTGKTRLAAAWARRAYQRDERTLFVCYNEPLAADLRSRLPEDDALRIGAFLTLALELDGMVPLTPPEGAGDEWWNVQAVGHLVRNWHRVTERFDTIIVDEAQDFSPAWLALLEALLDPDGPRRMLVLADEHQMLYPRGFTLPPVEDGWTRCELLTNCRNAFEIAQLLRRSLGGAPSPINRPGAIGVRWREAVDDATAIGAVRDELDTLLGVGERDPSRVMVVTTRAATRDALRTSLGLAPWEAGGGPGADRAVVCETVHRAKGLEADTVVLVCPDTEVRDTLLYVGISRAVSELVLVCPEPLARRFRLAAARGEDDASG